MLRLTLLRHAKSNWDEPELDDHERQLSQRGTAAALRIGRYISQNGLTPDLILCSDAIRTRATLALVLSALHEPLPETVITGDLYLASPESILDVIAANAGGHAHIMVIGHNPGLHALAISLPGKADQQDLTRLARKYPTAALAHITFDGDDWSEIANASGTLERFIVPRELAD